jgi:hypothetical protein
MVERKIVDGINILGVSFTLFGIMFIVPLAWQKFVMVIGFLITFVMANSIIWGLLKIRN